MKKMLILDDHYIFRKGLKQVIAESSNINVTDEAVTNEEALEEVTKKDYDLVLLDISSPGKGLSVLKELKARKPDLPVLVLGIYPEEQYLVQALRAGASGYLSRACAPGELLKALKEVSLGGKYVNSSIARKFVFGLSRDTSAASHKALSDREYQVMCLIAQGKTSKEISCQLKLSTKTISTYRSRVLEKLKLKNNSDLIRYVLAHDLI